MIDGIYTSTFKKIWKKGMAFLYLYIFCLFISIMLFILTNNGILIFPILIFSMLLTIKLDSLCNIRKNKELFESFCNEEMNEESFEKEIKDIDNLFKIQDIIITENWFFYNGYSKLLLIPILEIVWIYEKRQNAMSYLELNLKGDIIEEILFIDKSEIKVVIKEISMRNENTVIGYNEEIKKAYSDGNSNFTDKHKKIMDVKSPFVNPYFETIVYVRLEGKMKECLLAFTKELNIALIYGDIYLINRHVREVKKIKKSGAGYMSFIFNINDNENYIIKTFNRKMWKNIIKDIQKGKLPNENYRKKSYSSISDYEYTLSHNKYYFKYVKNIISIIFCGIMAISALANDSIYRNGGLLTGIIYIILPLIGVEIISNILLNLSILAGKKFLSKKEDSR